MSEIISSGDFLAVMNETFLSGGVVRFTPSGSSMIPLLNGTSDTVTLSNKPPILRKYDVIFYRRADDSLVLHRIVGCEKDGTYTLCGDNQLDFEKGVRYEDVLALMTAYSKNGKERTTSSFSYKLYSRTLLFRKKCHIALSKAYHAIFRKK